MFCNKLWGKKILRERHGGKEAQFEAMVADIDALTLGACWIG